MRIYANTIFFLPSSCRLFSFSNLFIVCLYIRAGYIDGCCGAYILAILCLPRGYRLAFWYSPPPFPPLASGHPFLPAEACILKGSLAINLAFCFFV
jgi:hypothetical protein